MSDVWTGWHFLMPDGRLRYGDGRTPRVGEKLTMRPTPESNCPKPCIAGMHASRRAIDALSYAPGPIACRVTLSGYIVDDGDKSCGYERTILAMADASDVLKEFMCQCVADVLPIAGEAGAFIRAVIKKRRAWTNVGEPSGQRNRLRQEDEELYDRLSEQAVEARAANDCEAWRNAMNATAALNAARHLTEHIRTPEGLIVVASSCATVCAMTLGRAITSIEDGFTYTYVRESNSEARAVQDVKLTRLLDALLTADVATV